MKKSNVTFSNSLLFHGKEISCIYFYDDIIVQFLINPTQNCPLHKGKPARKKFSSNFFVSLSLFALLSVVEMKGEMVVILKSLENHNSFFN